MKGQFNGIADYFEEIDQRVDNNLTFIGIFPVLIASEVLDKPFLYGMTVVIVLLLIRIGWDLINPDSREQKRYRKTLSIALVFIFLAATIWLVIRILLPYPFGILYGS